MGFEHNELWDQNYIVTIFLNISSKKKKKTFFGYIHPQMIKIMISNTHLMCSPQFIVDVLTKKKKLLCLIYLPTSQSGSLVEFCKPIFFYILWN